MILAFTTIKGRPELTELTLESLGRSDCASDITVLPVVVPERGLDRVVVAEMVRKAGLRLGVIEYPTIDGESSCRSARRCFATARVAIRGLLSAADLADCWILWFENDVIFNPGWQVALAYLHGAIAAEGRRPGLLSPIFMDVPVHNARRIPVADPDLHTRGLIYVEKEWMASQCYLMRPEVVQAVDLEAPFWNKQIGWDGGIGRQLTAKGFVNACWPMSDALHTGMWGLTWQGQDDYPSIGFVPDPRVLDLVIRAGEINLRETQRRERERACGSSG